MPDYDDDKLIDDTSAPIFRKVEAGVPVASLPASERVVACICAAQGVIDNGGLAYFFGSDWPGQPPYAVFVDAYRAIGVSAVADGITATLTAFGFPEPHLDLGSRQAGLEERGSDEAFARRNDEVLEQSEAVWSHLARYIREHDSGIADV